MVHGHVLRCLVHFLLFSVLSPSLTNCGVILKHLCLGLGEMVKVHSIISIVIIVDIDIDSIFAVFYAFIAITVTITAAITINVAVTLAGNVACRPCQPEAPNIRLAMSGPTC
jgi:hypothetical protein